MERRAPGYTLHANKDENSHHLQLLLSCLSQNRKEEGKGIRAEDEGRGHSREERRDPGCSVRLCELQGGVLAKQSASMVPVGAAGGRDFCRRDLAKLPSHLSGLSLVVPWQKHILGDVPR